MMVTFVSQCEKNSLKRTRRVLDSFANRIGDNVWQTVITQEGLNTVRRMLRRTASKNTAVSCHWIRSRVRTELVWIVGNKNRFDKQGVIPVHYTTRNTLHMEWENNWVSATIIQIVAVLAALLHDIGKASVGFQKKLIDKKFSLIADPYRHEWISLRLFQAMIADCKDDVSWLTRLANFNAYMEQNPNWLDELNNDGADRITHKLSELPPLARLIAWLVVTHHRMPFYGENYFAVESRSNLKTDDYFFDSSFEEFISDLKPVSRWVKNERSCKEREDIGDFWKFGRLAMQSRKWQVAVTRWANKALKHDALMQFIEKGIGDPFVMHLARLCLMVGDHNYSSLGPEDPKRVRADTALNATLFANTDVKSKKPKQQLDEHLIGVGQFTARFASILPRFSSELPTVENHRLFALRTSEKRFKWQNKAYDLASSLQVKSVRHGFFGVNMASTGSGKTLANARIMYALADPKVGARFTIALGLRVLTLQTGQALRDKLKLDQDSIAVLVGGKTYRTLFELSQSETNESESDSRFASLGSESLMDLVDGTVDSFSCENFEAELGTTIANEKARALLFSPIVTCTVDHIMEASENTRGGKHIIPILRLLTSDLVLDEPDDFSQEDLPALARLVYMAGLFGSRIVLSSATLTPDLISGLYSAYLAGRTIWNHHMGLGNERVICAWFDENLQHHGDYESVHQFYADHASFVSKRCTNLSNEPPRRIAKILSIDLPVSEENEKLNYQALAETLLKSSLDLHKLHHEKCPLTGSTASIGLIRLANIGPLVHLARAMYSYPHSIENIQVHLCCYHARQLLLLRNALEMKLDKILYRTGGNSIFHNSEVNNAISRSAAQHHIFIVLASPVAEVGRDHDYDWGIVEPSSMRSIIQLVGRVWRHRPEKTACEPNVLIMRNNIKALKLGGNFGVGSVVFARPGFEEQNFLLSTHHVDELIPEQQLNPLTAIPRISKPASLQPESRLADLEHAVMANLLNPVGINFVNAFWQTGKGNQASVHLQLVSPFRYQLRKQDEFVCLLNDTQEFNFKLAEQAWLDPEGSKGMNQYIRMAAVEGNSPLVRPWLTTGIDVELKRLAKLLSKDNLIDVALRFAVVQLDENQGGWCFHPWLGFWED